jgi:hypothetical protein
MFQERQYKGKYLEIGPRVSRNLDEEAAENFRID